MMRWKDLLSPVRAGRYAKPGRPAPDLRSEFEKDYHRIIGSASFRRLQDKTQVFPLDKSDFIRTRLTHSLEVSSFAKSLGQNIAQYILKNEKDSDFTLQTQSDICDILQCAGLIHDIGNPPFGHFGEEAIRDWFIKNLSRMSCGGVPVTELLTLLRIKRSRFGSCASSGPTFIVWWNRQVSLLYGQVSSLLLQPGILSTGLSG